MTHEGKTHHNACACQEAEYQFQIERRDRAISALEMKLAEEIAESTLLQKAWNSAFSQAMENGQAANAANKKLAEITAISEKMQIVMDDMGQHIIETEKKLADVSKERDDWEIVARLCKTYLDEASVGISEIGKLLKAKNES